MYSRLAKPGQVDLDSAARNFRQPASKWGKTVTKTPVGSQTDSPDHGCMPRPASLKWVNRFQLNSC
jgi:hypothetical protein